MLTSAALAVYFVELLKEFFAWVLKTPGFEFSPKVLAAVLVLANAAAILTLATLGVTGYDYPTDWVAWAKTLAVSILTALVSSALYVMGYKPFKAYAMAFKAGLRKSVL